ncbi:ABC transporter permease, partial [Kocuria sp. CPCC 205236]
GLAAGLLFRSESAVGAASGMLVVLSFFGNLFVPLSGVMLDIARFTPLYGLAGLARYPLVEGDVVSTSGPPVESDPLWALLLNTGVWTVVLAAVVLLAVRRTTVRR